VELRLVVQTPGRPDRELAAEVRPDHLVRELRDALAARLELGDTHQLLCPRAGGRLDPARPIAKAGLRTGDRVLLSDRPPALPAAEARRAVVDLLVAGGPDAGRAVPLTAGEHRIGRFRYSSIVLDDPGLSRVHLVATVTSSGAVTVRDAGSEGGLEVAGRHVTGAAPVRPGELVTAGGSVLTFEPHAPDPPRPEADAAGRVAFNRPPRLARAAPRTAFQLDAPPQRERGHRLPLSTAIVPLAMGLVMYAFFRQVLYLLFLLLAPVMAVFSFLEAGIGGRRRYRRERRAYRARLEALDGELAEAREAAAEHLHAATPDAVRLVRRARALAPSLWERRPDAPDWLLLRVGWADRPAGITVEVAPGGEDELRREVEAVAARHRLLRAAPLQVSLREAGVLGVCGDGERAAALARALAIQLATLHRPDDLVLAAAVPDDEQEPWRWLGWLPHVTSEPAASLAPCVVRGRTAARGLVDRLLAVVAERREARMAFHGTAAERLGPSIVAFLHERADLPRGAAAVLLEQGPPVGVRVVWLGGDRDALPGECGAVVDLDDGDRGTVTFPLKGESLPARGVEGAAVEVAGEVARLLAPVRDVSARESQAGIPRRVDLVELLGLSAPTGAEARIMANWIWDRASPHQRRLAAVVGMAAGGEPLTVSLRGDGPHALVGGMTGSGKSELLQSLVASLAVAHSPRSLNFLLVDYKGGAAFKDCVDLAHTVGFVTDLDGHLVNRALASLRAELRRREEMLRAAGAKDLLDLERRDPDRTPPSLLIVVDEFAALAAELPEFVDGMVDVAQRGRSLGIHLLLATQRPQGVINDRIRANTNLRLSLRFSDESESLDVIGTRDAARPGLPSGRAFARTGPGEVVEFQAGYVGGRVAAAGGPEPVVVRDLSFGGVPVAANGHLGASPFEPMTDLVRLVAAVRTVNRTLAIPPPRRPWLPTLPEVVPLESLAPLRPRRPALGLLDDPSGQRQIALDLDLEADGNLLVFGTSGSGKTSLLRAIAVSAALGAPPAALHVYGLDFATRGLRPLEALPHCGGVICGDEPERVIRLLGMLRAETERRKRVLAASAAATIAEHLLLGGREHLPTLLVLLDGYPGLVSALEGIDIGVHVDALRELVAEGRPLGITFVIATDRQAGYLSALSASVVRRLVLRMASDDEYAMCGLARSVYAGARLPPGRGFTEGGFEVQCPIVGTDPGGGAQAAAIAAIGASLRRLHGDGDAAPVRLLPARVPRGSLPPPGRPLEAVVGIEDRGLEATRIDLDEGHFLVAGPRRSGRTTALATFAVSLRGSPEPPELHLLAPRRHSRLPELDVWSTVAVGLDDCVAGIERLAAAAREGDRPCRVLVIDDGEELADSTIPDLDWIAQRGQDHGLRILVGAETQAAQRAFGGWLTQVLRERQGLLLDADPAVDGTILGAMQLPRRRGAWPAGRAYLVRRGAVELVQVAAD
jgi:S-DNA-T family DNA segregation ATPase FtsK/SpoIIIE